MLLEPHSAREAKGPTYRFSPTQRESCHLNVLDAVRWGQDEAFGDVQRCVHGMLSPDPGEPWNDFRLEAVPLLEAIVHDRQAAGEGNFPAVLRWMTEPSRSMKQKAEALLRSPIPVVSAGGRRLLDKSDRMAAALWSAALSALTIYQDPLVAAHTTHSDFDVSDLQHGTRPVSLYLTPPFADVRRLRPLLGTLTEMLVSRFSAQQARPRQKVLLALDELGNLGRLDEFERGQSYLQGCGVQTLQVWQNILQFRQTYGEESPLLASVATQVYYTPGDPATAAYLSTQLGVSTERLYPRTEHVSFWGLFQGSSIGETEHARSLLTPDECRRLDESAAVVVVKGLAPILGQKLGVEASPIPAMGHQVTPLLRRVAMVAGAVILAAGVASWALWPNSTPPPLSPTTPESGRFTGGDGRVTIPVQVVNLPDGFTIKGMPATIEVEVRGPAGDLVPVRIDASQVRPGPNYYLLSRHHVAVPPGAEVQGIYPPLLQFEVEDTDATTHTPPSSGWSLWGAPEGRRKTFSEWSLMTERPAWGLFKLTTHNGRALTHALSPEIGQYAQPDACKAAKAQRLSALQSQLYQFKPGQLGITWDEHGYTQRTGPKAIRREVWICAVAVSSDT